MSSGKEGTKVTSLDREPEQRKNHHLSCGSLDTNSECRSHIDLVLPPPFESSSGPVVLELDPTPFRTIAPSQLTMKSLSVESATTQHLANFPHNGYDDADAILLGQNLAVREMAGVV